MKLLFALLMALRELLTPLSFTILSLVYIKIHVFTLLLRLETILTAFLLLLLLLWTVETSPLLLVVYLLVSLLRLVEALALLQ